MSESENISLADQLLLTGIDSLYWAIADGRVDARVEDLFVQDGTLALGNLVLEGRDAIARFFIDRETQNRTSGRHTRHISGQRSIELESASSAQASSVVLVFAGSGDLPLEAAPPSTIGDVTDDLVKHENRWLFRSRIIKPVFVGAGAAKFAR